MALSAYINSSDELKAYIKRRLGEPVINVELTDEQLNDSINLAIETFQEFAESGANIRFMTLAQQTGVQEYQLDYDVLAINGVFDTSEITLDAPFPDKVVSDHFGTTFGKSELLSLQLTRQYLADLKFVQTVPIRYNYNSATNKIYFIANPIEDKTLGIAYYAKTDYTDTTNGPMYNHLWIKKYAVALSREQWAMNLSKYSGSVLPQGLTMNADQILTKANEELEKLQEELNETWTPPVGFYTG